MPLDQQTIEAIAERLDTAERSRVQIRQPSIDHPQIGMEDAYAVQRIWVANKIARGNPLKGHKIGLTSATMQRSSNITEPDYGALLEDMFFANGATIPAGRFILPRVEVELAFILRDRLSGPACTIFDVLNATEFVVPAIEIIDARCHQIDPETRVTRKVFDNISDNAGNAGVVLGGLPFRPEAVDMRWVSALLHRNGVIEESGVAAAVLNHPANGPAWLANKLQPHGVTLEPGQVILGGSFTAPVPARPGDTFHADYGPLGSITLHFAPLPIVSGNQS